MQLLVVDAPDRLHPVPSFPASDAQGPLGRAGGRGWRRLS